MVLVTSHEKSAAYQRKNMSSSFINSQTIKVESATEREDIHITIHIGVFFDGILSDFNLASQLSELYSPEVNGNNERKYVICSTPDQHKKHSMAIDEDDDYADAIGGQINTVFSRLNAMLAADLGNAQNITISIDTFGIDDGGLTAAIFCNCVKPGTIENPNHIVERAEADLTEGGIIGDYRMRGAEIELHSFTNIDSRKKQEETIGDNKPDRTTILEGHISKENTNVDAHAKDDDMLTGYVSQESDNDEALQASRNNISNSSKAETTILKGYVKYDRDLSKGPNGSYISADKRNPLQKSFDRAYTWLYLTGYNSREWLDQTARNTDIIALFTLETGAGEALEIGSLCLKGASTLISLGMAILIFRNRRERQANLDRAWQSTLDMIPWDRIIGHTIEAGFGFIIRRINRPRLRVIDGGGGSPNPSAIPSTAKPMLQNDNVVQFPNKQEDNVVRISQYKRKSQTRKVANGEPVIIEDDTPNLTIVDYDGNTSNINNINPFSYAIRIIQGASNMVHGSNNNDLRVNPIEANSNGDRFRRQTPDQNEQYAKTNDAKTERYKELLLRIQANPFALTSEEWVEFNRLRETLGIN